MDSDTLESASMTKQSDNTSSSDGSTKDKCHKVVVILVLLILL